MIDFLLGVPGKLVTLLSRISAVRAGYLDNLSAGAVAQAATAVSNVSLTTARAGYLDNISAGAVAMQANPLLMPPIAANFPVSAYDYPDTTFVYMSTGIQAQCPGVVVSTASVTYVDVVNVTGSGVINFVMSANSAAYSGTVKITIDGVVVVADQVLAASKGRVFVGSASYLGTAGQAYITLDQIPFRSSLQIQHKSANAGNSIYTFYKIRRTS